jgi:hypothetical protein
MSNEHFVMIQRLPMKPDLSVTMNLLWLPWNFLIVAYATKESFTSKNLKRFLKRCEGHFKKDSKPKKCLRSMGWPPPGKDNELSEFCHLFVITLNILTSMYFLFLVLSFIKSWRLGFIRSLCVARSFIKNLT